MSSENVQNLSQQIERIVAAATDGIVVLDTQKRYVFANAAAEKILGVSREVILRRVFEESEWRLSTVKGVPLPDEENPFTLVLSAHKGVYGKKVVIERPDGQRVIISINASPLFDKTGNLEGMVGIFSDVTEEFELQERSRVFLHTVAHDLRVPLSVVKGYAEMLQDACAESRTHDNMNAYVVEIAEAVEKMERMLDDLVDDAQIEGGSVSLILESVDVEGFVMSLVEGNREAFDESRIETAIDQNLPDVLADPGRLERILLNLVSNALKFSSTDSKVVIEARKSEDGDVIISVLDQGRGLSDEDSARIFRRFFQVGSKENTHGIGLGLYISRLLVEAHGGRIWVESTLGQGSAFRFTLPTSVSAQ